MPHRLGGRQAELINSLHDAVPPGTAQKQAGCWILLDTVNMDVQ
jgi:hypothetical protein